MLLNTNTRKIMLASLMVLMCGLMSASSFAKSTSAKHNKSVHKKSAQQNNDMKPMYHDGEYLACHGHRDADDSLQSSLCAAHASMFVQGQTVRVVLPKRYFFNPGEVAEIKVERIALVRRLAHWIEREYPKAPLAIVGHTDNIGSAVQQKARSKQMASAVASYLWNDNLPLAKMTILGVGGEKNIASNRTLVGRYFNERVEIHVTLPRRLQK